jgi:hypothetical protein
MMAEPRAADQIARRDYHFIVTAAALPDGSPSTKWRISESQSRQHFLGGASG